jgi:hypothetical protein
MGCDVHRQWQANGQACWLNFSIQERETMKGNVAAFVLIGFGTFFLLTNLGMINVSLAELLKTWWPLILIAVGLSLFFTNKK